MWKILFASVLGFVAMASATRLCYESGQEIIGITDAGITNHYIEDQPSFPFHEVTQLCTAGVWVTYTGENYSFGPGAGAINIFPYMDYLCRAPISSRLGSTRYAGIRGNYSKPSVTLFSDIDLMGDSIAVEDELANIGFDTHSLVTIESRFEFFQDINFNGESICLHIDPNSCVEKVCWLWTLYPGELPWGTAARSARVGCGADAKVHMAITDKGQNPVTHKKQ